MKKIFLVVLSIVIFVVLIVGLMFALNICPPRGPWPMPPWCRADFTRYEYEVDVTPAVLSQIKAVNMYDTWGRNYNMGMIETTQTNIESSFDRVQRLGAEEVYVHDFDRVIYEGETDYQSTKYKLVDETFWNDFRDQSISRDDLKKIADAAHARGMKLGVKRNLAFVNIGKFILSGISGKITEDVSRDYAEFNRDHSEAWIRDYFSKWQARMVEKAQMYQAVGVDIMNISPTFQAPTFAGHEELANNLWKDLIMAVKSVFKGQVAVDLNVYGLVDGNNGAENWQKYDYYRNADIVEVKVYKILEKYQDKLGQNDEIMKQKIEMMVSDLDAKARDRGVKISVFYAPSSYENGVFAGPVEFLDIKNPSIMGLNKDYDEQVLAFNYFFDAVKDKKNIVRINAGNFAWDDAIDPEVRPKISVSAGFRNKPAEQVVAA